MLENGGDKIEKRPLREVGDVERQSLRYVSWEPKGR